MTITRQTGFPVDNNPTSASPSESCTTIAVGDILLLYGRVSTTTATITSVTGGLVAAWTQVLYSVVNGVTLYCYWGVVNATGTSTTTINFSTTVTAEMVFDEFTTGGTPTWAIATSSTTSGTSTAPTCPSLTPASSGDAYVGYIRVANTGSAGSTSGFTYTVLSTTTNVACFNGTVTSGTPYAPAAVQSTSGAWCTFGLLLSAATTSPSVLRGRVVSQAATRASTY